jgi:DNA polymerase-1
MSRAYTGSKIDTIADILPERKTMLDLETAVVAKKCLDDCLATLRVYLKMDGPAWWSADSHTWSYELNWYEGCDPLEPTSYTVTQAMKDCYQVDMKLTPLLMRMSRRGIALRADLVEDWYERTSKAMFFFQDICTKEGFEPSKPQQVGLTLAARGNFLPFTESGKQLATGEEVLNILTDPLAVVVLKYREYSKLKGTYLEKMRGQARSYTHFRMDLSTARLSSYDVNLQNIPERIREIFAPDTGLWTDFDLSQIELRLFAYITKDPVMLQAYADGSDIHATTQEALWPGTDPKDKQMRRRAKVFNFAKIFYAVIKSLAAYTKLPEEVCRAHDNTWRETYPVAHQWMKDQEEGEEWVENLYGRRCRLPAEIYTTWKHKVNCRVCYPTQSGAAEIIKRIMLECEAMGMDQALQVHDSILIEGRVELPPELAYICPEIHTPFNAPVSPYWS